jgi:hypothetical protein
VRAAELGRCDTRRVRGRDTLNSMVTQPRRSRPSRRCSCRPGRARQPRPQPRGRSPSGHHQRDRQRVHGHDVYSSGIRGTGSQLSSLGALVALGVRIPSGKDPSQPSPRNRAKRCSYCRTKAVVRGRALKTSRVAHRWFCLDNPFPSRPADGRVDQLGAELRHPRTCSKGRLAARDVRGRRRDTGEQSPVAMSAALQFWTVSAPEK